MIILSIVPLFYLLLKELIFILNKQIELDTSLRVKVLRNKKFLIISFLAFVSIIPSFLIILAFWEGEFAGLISFLHILPIFSMLWVGKSLINLYRDVEDAVNRNLGYGISAFGFYYLLLGWWFLVIYGGTMLFLAWVPLVVAGFLAFKRRFILSSLGVTLALFLTIGDIIMGNGGFDIVISHLSIGEFSFLWVLPVFTLLLTTILIYTSVKDEKYFTKISLISESPKSDRRERGR